MDNEKKMEKIKANFTFDEPKVPAKKKIAKSVYVKMLEEYVDELTRNYDNGSDWIPISKVVNKLKSMLK